MIVGNNTDSLGAVMTGAFVCGETAEEATHLMRLLPLCHFGNDLQ